MSRPRKKARDLRVVTWCSATAFHRPLRRPGDSAQAYATVCGKTIPIGRCFWCPTSCRSFVARLAAYTVVELGGVPPCGICFRSDLIGGVSS